MPRHFLAIAACFLALSSIASAQQSQGDQVAGKVVSEIDGHPLAHATITLTDIKTERLAATVVADDDGHFSFAGVAPGKYRVTGAAARFIAGSYLQHEGYSTAIVTGAGLATDSLVLQLTPTAAISGRVLDESGEPVGYAAVVLYREDLTGAEHVTRFRNTQTDDDGEYELTGLPRGRYFLSATGKPWYAVHPPPEQEGANPPYRLAVDPALDVAYPTIFYPDALDSDGASPLTVHGGEQLTANMQLYPQHAVTLTLRLAPGEKPNQQMPQLTRSVFGVDENVQVQMEFTQSERRMTGVPPGHYNVQEIAPGNGIPTHSESISLTSGSTSVDIPEAAELATINATVHDVNGALIVAPLPFNLYNTQLNRFAGGRVSDKGVAELANIPRGDYSLVLDGAKRLNVVRLSVNGQPIADKRLHITGGGKVAVDVTVSAAAVRVEGFARRDDKPAAASMVVLVPAGADTSEELFRRDQSDLDGSFVFSDVVPGNYILIAIDDGWPLHWTDMTALAPYLTHGLPVTVAANGSSTLRIAEPVATQPR
jgi:5-hydroxyisourate hydrolase-like protein (transthyretin family)